MNVNRITGITGVTSQILPNINKQQQATFFKGHPIAFDREVDTFEISNIYNETPFDKAVGWLCHHINKFLDKNAPLQ